MQYELLIFVSAVSSERGRDVDSYGALGVSTTRWIDG